MNRSLLIVYSNLGLGGMPVRIVDIVNTMTVSHPKTKISILLKERRAFDLRNAITNPNVTIHDLYSWCPIDSAGLFVLWVWMYILIHRPRTILSFISPYALPVLATKLLFFWRLSTVIVNEGHYTSTMVRSMAWPAVQRLGIQLLYPLANTIIVPTRAIRNDLHTSFGVPTHAMTIIPNWSRYADIPIGKTRREYDIIYTGRIEKEKNILRILGLLHQLITVQKLSLSCLIVGEGSQLINCHMFIKAHKLDKHISILPPTIHVSTLLKRSKVFLFNPDKTTEGFPVSILDAMACGTLVITKKFRGVEDVINADNGYIAHTNMEMGTYISHALHHYAFEHRRIRLAKLFVSRNNSLANVKAYTDLFQ